ncbi:hypothetical protein J437_LFUL002633 [Ladona fulva]|uniref:HIG1 domain-containing protein n=1 Tax=Ladona fulva TaxID=123851 RepID=A0A8K0JVY4_LADFU|nr:hypothetical protein J437_LFUL002633 [Ladona fulva]
MSCRLQGKLSSFTFLSPIFVFEVESLRLQCLLNANTAENKSQKMTSTPSYVDETHAEKLARKAKDAPFLVVGILGLIGACGYGVYAYKNRGKMSTSVYLMQLRVGAQGAVVGALTLGVAYNLIREYVLPHIEKKD